MIYLYDTAGDRCSACEGKYGLRCFERPTVTPAFGIHLCAVHAPGWHAHDAAKKRRLLNAAIDQLLDQDVTLDEISNEIVRRRGAWNRGEGVDQTVLAAERTGYQPRLADEAVRDEIREAGAQARARRRAAAWGGTEQAAERLMSEAAVAARPPGVAAELEAARRSRDESDDLYRVDVATITALLERDQQTFDRFFPEPFKADDRALTALQHRLDEQALADLLRKYPSAIPTQPDLFFP